MRLDVMLTEYGFPGGVPAIGPAIADVARRADSAGFGSVWVTDHLFQSEWPGSGRSATDPMLEAYSTLAFIAAATERIGLGAMVTPVTFRQPGLLAKTVTTLDVLSGGRATLGIGAGWDEREHVGLGVPFPPLAERFERLEETLRIVRQMWSDDDGPFEGMHYQLAETIGEPRPISRPHPPIVVGGGGEKKTLRLVAQYADACNLYPTLELPHKLDVLRRHCAHMGRNYDEIERTVQLWGNVATDGAEGSQSPEQLLATLAELAGQGIDRAILIVPERAMAATVDLIGERVLPEAAGLTTAGR